MCRLFGQIAPEPTGAWDLLVGSDRSLLRQSDHNPKNLQKDGWGVGYFQGGEARVIKSPGPIYEESRRFDALAHRVRSHVIVGHIRAASNPRGLPHRRLISPANTQPFTDGRILFAHNGTLQIPDEVSKFLGPYRRRLRGLNDSEVYFWQFRKFLDAHGSIPKALQACVRETWAIWHEIRRRNPDKKSPYTGLNTLVSDGRSLYAMCHYRGAPNSSSLFDPAQPWGTMSLSRRPDRVLVASEDLDGGRWIWFGDPEILSATPTSGGIQVTRRRFRIRSLG